VAVSTKLCSSLYALVKALAAFNAVWVSRFTVTATVVPISAVCRLSVTPLATSETLFEVRERSTPSTRRLASLPAVTSRSRPVDSTANDPTPVVPPPFTTLLFTESERVSCESPPVPSVSLIFPPTSDAVAG
jgi:hypothetical protein